MLPAVQSLDALLLRGLDEAVHHAGVAQLHMARVHLLALDLQPSLGGVNRKRPWNQCLNEWDVFRQGFLFRLLQ